MYMYQFYTFFFFCSPLSIVRQTLVLLFSFNYFSVGNFHGKYRLLGNFTLNGVSIEKQTHDDNEGEEDQCTRLEMCSCRNDYSFH